MKRIRFISLVMVFILLFNTVVFAEGTNIDSGEDSSVKAVNGWFLATEYMYKVSLYVGKQEGVNTTHSIDNFYRVGTKPIFLSADFNIPEDTYVTNKNKIDYLKMGSLENQKNNFGLKKFGGNRKIIRDLPPPPATGGGNKEDLIKFIERRGTVVNILRDIALNENTTRANLLEGLDFYIDNEWQKLTLEEILPLQDDDGNNTNKVPWLIVYEPIHLLHLAEGTKGNAKNLLLTATELAILQLTGIYDFLYGENGQYVGSYTHAGLPNSSTLESRWVGFNAFKPTTKDSNGKVIHWKEDSIIKGGGWGMRFLSSNEDGGGNKRTPPSFGDVTYRVNTDVITSVPVIANGTIAPNNRSKYNGIDMESEEYIEGMANLKDTRGYVTINTSTGKSKTMSFTLQGGEEYAWIKWKTPKLIGDESITFIISGNDDLTFEDGSKEKKITANIIDLEGNEPPDPKAEDRNNKFKYKKIQDLTKDDVTEATWYTYKAKWEADIEERERTVIKERYEDGSPFLDEDGNPESRKIKETYNVDLGTWEFEEKEHGIKLGGKVELLPVSSTAIKSYKQWEMKSGYGFEIDVKGSIFNKVNVSTSHYTRVQNVVTYFSDFNYEDYWRVLDKKVANKYEFKKNKYSPDNSRIHFTPIWYPDGKDYTVKVEIIDVWTPAGMLRKTLKDDIEINGNLYDDWHIAPDRVK